MELREWLIILGLALVILIVIDGVRRLQRQRRTPRLDDVMGELDPEAEAKAAEVAWELPNGGARVVKPADFSHVQPMPKLERQQHPGPSRVLHEFQTQYRNGQSDKSNRGAVTEPNMLPDSGAEKPPVVEPCVSVLKPLEQKPSISVPEPQEQEPSVLEEAAAPSSAQPRPATDTDTPRRREPVLSAMDDDDEALSTVRLSADPEDHGEHEEQDYRLVDFEGMGDSLKSHSRQVGSSMQRLGASLQKSLTERRQRKRAEGERRAQLNAEKAAEKTRLAEQKAAERQAARAAAETERARLLEQQRLKARARTVIHSEDHAEGSSEDRDPLFTPRRSGPGYSEPSYSGSDHRPESRPDTSDKLVADESVVEPLSEASAANELRIEDNKVRCHPVLEKALSLSHDVNAEHARDSLSSADELIIISVMSREPAGFSGSRLLELVMACGLRYSRDMGVFNRFETEDAGSALQFSMANALNPGRFPIEAMDDFMTPGITLLMPLPGAGDTPAAFEAMIETAMVISRNLTGVLKDENRSVMTGQTIEFARLRVQEFERRYRLRRYQAN